MAITPSGPDAPQPLTDRERRILDAIGEDLAAESPALGKRLSALPRPRRRGGIVDEVLCVLAVLAVLGMFLPPSWFVAIVLTVVMIFPALFAARSLPEGDPTDNAGDDPNSGWRDGPALR